MRERQVILLWNLPRTPQHNVRAERRTGDFMCASGLDKESRLARPKSRVGCAARLVEAWYRLDACTPRASLGNRTPLELDRIALQTEDRACRARFYREVCEEQERIARLPCGARDRRKLTREAIWNALEQRDLVQRTRGGQPVWAFKPEVIS